MCWYLVFYHASAQAIWLAQRYWLKEEDCQVSYTDLFACLSTLGLFFSLRSSFILCRSLSMPLPSPQPGSFWPCWVCSRGQPFSARWVLRFRKDHQYGSGGGGEDLGWVDFCWPSWVCLGWGEHDRGKVPGCDCGWRFCCLKYGFGIGVDFFAISFPSRSICRWPASSKWGGAEFDATHRLSDLSATWANLMADMTFLESCFK
jgi:hypothetical protein